MALFPAWPDGNNSHSVARIPQIQVQALVTVRIVTRISTHTPRQPYQIDGQTAPESVDRQWRHLITFSLVYLGLGNYLTPTKA